MPIRKTAAIAGVLVMIPALALVLSSLLGFRVPFRLIHPALVVGGLFLALALNLFPIVSARTHLEHGNLVGALSIKLKGASLNWVVAFLSAVLLGLIALYLFVENFQPR
jgi:hypothetical protein